MNKLFKNAMVWIVIAVVLLTVFQSFTPNSIRQQTLDYTSFIELVKTGNVSEVVFEDNTDKSQKNQR
ncbi:MAG: ATP-dependent metallopeptidase FtsH/Yme1/Tma family protein [Gammaproteobacteria bacterium]|nr:ATP-dependent metallopeptidase FtsH/Yme1/Tma family protein [Gammaproteobacteria bacterium]